MMRGMADGHTFANLDANDDGAVELTRSGRTAASLSREFVGGGTPGVRVELAENGKGAPQGAVLNWGCQYWVRCLGRF
jgi:hypothetical protein